MTTTTDTPDRPDRSDGPRALLPTPGNAELLVYVLALALAAIVVGIADLLAVPSWFDFFKWISVAYLLSRGIAKASRVYEY
jgi:hypothetical protein